MVPRKHAGTRMGLLQQSRTKNLLHVLILLEAVGTLALMSYALLYEAGNLVNLPDKCIGFYNFCLWNNTAGELQCLDTKHLQAMGISLLQLGLARVCVYTCLVFILFHLPFVLNVTCTEQREEWKMICTIPLINMIMLSGGLGMFILQTSQWIHPSDFTGGFLALLGTQALLLLQTLTTTVYLNWAKYTHMC
ncbi:transmembrane protein 140 [Taeniopygia guttata]|uniref:Transmembrane protein 140 n=1 Tax=Taeniopygia guttata TaxID=59729 RepID=A0A674GPR1_TAEGU|nr:transmembrane protein 140 [Taeniopygia guttata]XP_030118530.3 transmembrane protein 140 [Taeniopygia guttata]XP_030118537.3 transmembrane protein 140 [Taeniopygia guttata]XP_030118542.3 transmembrane protein 140 [Taeniopygia guttata]XP_041569439.1 transmembrane protein 140 [Taeniopygia guttata]